MLQCKKTYVPLFLIIVLISCTPHTGSIIYLSSSKPEINAVGIAPLHKRSDYYDTLFPWLRKNYDSLMTTEFTLQLESNSFGLSSKIDYFNPDKEAIKNICMEAGLDAILISKIDFTKVIVGYGPIPLNTYYDHVLQSKLFDKNGVFIYHVSNSTLGNKQVRKFKNEIALHSSIRTNVELIHKLQKVK
jgi:hypothetical protein